MLKRLYKHEFYSLYKTMLPIYAALCLLALLSRISYLVLNSGENDILFFSLIKGSITALYGLGLISMMIIALVIAIKRFGTNCFSHEGYLTFSLPFTATEHLVCKLVCGAVVMITTVIAEIISICIVGIGTELFSDILKGIPTVIKGFFEVFNPAEGAVLIVAGAAALIIFPFTYLCQFYFCAAFGQQYKNRVAASIITYFVLYAATQMISTVLIMPVSFLFDKITKTLSLFAICLTVIMAVIVVEIVYGLILFLVTRHEMTYKLNLA